MKRRQRRNRRCRAFALVMALFLLAMMMASVSALSLTAGLEGLRARRTAQSLDHRLAVESAITYLPELLSAERSEEANRRGSTLTPVATQVGPCRVTAVLRRLQGNRQRGDFLEAQLRAQAQAWDLNADAIRLRPLITDSERLQWPRYLWYDQVIQASGPDELFRYGVPDGDLLREARTVWSDHLSFIPNDGPTWACTLVTTIDSDVRRWFAVLAERGDSFTALYLGSL